MSTLALTQAPHPTLYNGGEAPNTRQNFVATTQGAPQPAPRIEAALEGLQPGELRSVFASSGDLIFGVSRPDRLGAHGILDWTPKNIWHAPTQQIIHYGRRIRNKVIAYSDVIGDWREEAMPAALGRATGSGHGYGLIAQDGAGHVYINGFQLTPEGWTWRELPAHILTNGGHGSMMEWMPNALGGRGGLVKYGGDARRFLMFDPQAWDWAFHVSGLPCGQHALIEYHPAHGKLLMVGGTNTGNTAALVDEFGSAQLVSPCPASVRMTNSWIARHPAGAWLVRNNPAGLFAYWPTEDRWDNLGPVPDAALSYPTVAQDEARGVLYITHLTGLHVYKLPTL